MKSRSASGRGGSRRRRRTLHRSVSKLGQGNATPILEPPLLERTRLRRVRAPPITSEVRKTAETPSPSLRDRDARETIHLLEIFRSSSRCEETRRERRRHDRTVEIAKNSWNLGREYSGQLEFESPIRARRSIKRV